MSVHIQEVVGTVQRAPEHASGQQANRALGRGSEAPVPDDVLRAFLAREAQLAERVRAD